MNKYIALDLAEFYYIPKDLFEKFQKPNSLLEIITENETLFIRTTSFSYTKKCVLPDYYMFPKRYMLCQSSEHGSFIAHNNYPKPPELIKCPFNVQNPKVYKIKDVIVLF